MAGTQRYIWVLPASDGMGIAGQLMLQGCRNFRSPAAEADDIAGPGAFSARCFIRERRWSRDEGFTRFVQRGGTRNGHHTYPWGRS